MTVTANRFLDARARRHRVISDIKRVPPAHRLIAFAWPTDDATDWSVMGDVDASMEWVAECRRVLDACEQRLKESSDGE